MKSSKELHDEAMELVEQATLGKIMGSKTSGEILSLNIEAYEKEKAAALLTTVEPSRSILLRSAATLAFRANKFKATKELIELGLSGNPPDEIKGELEDLLQDINDALTMLEEKRQQGFKIIHIEDV